MEELIKQHPLYKADLDIILHTKGIEDLKGKRILITGSTGLLGKCLVDALMLYNEEKDANISIYAVGRNREKAFYRFGYCFNSPLFHFIEQDVRQAFPLDLQVDYIIPLASNTHPLAYSRYPIETIEINVKGAEHALNKAVDCGATVLYPSSVEVYGNARGGDIFSEDYTGSLNLSTARSCYTESKRVCEALCQSFLAERGVNVKIARLSRVFGPTMLETDTKASSQFMQKALRNENIVLKSQGEQFFSYIYVADAISAMLFVMLHGKMGLAYNISSDDCNVHLKDFATICARWADTEVIYDLPSDAEKKGYSIAQQAILDSQRLKSLGWESEYKIQTAIERALNILGNK